MPRTPCHPSIFLQLIPSLDSDDQLHPAGRHVPQTSGDPSRGIPEWIADGDAVIENTDIVLWHTFGITHFPSPEDFPIMPAEPMTLLLRPRNFFTKNPALDVPPSYCSTPSQVAGKGAVLDAADKVSKLVVAGGDAQCCREIGMKSNST